MSDEANLNPNLEPDQVSADFEPETAPFEPEPSNTEPSDSEPSEAEPMFDSLTGQAIMQPVVPQINLAVLEGLSNQLVWKIGKEEGSERVVVRVGYASATGSFRELPKLRGATDAEVADAAKLGELVVEWIE
jgi:hypothetical protein